jgi:hypothetical protein
MRVKHKNAEKNNSNPSMALCAWYKDYYPNKKYLNYEFYEVLDIFDLYEIDQTNGNLTYVMSDFASLIFPKVRENPKKFVYKEHDPKYLDEYLMPRNISYSGLSFFKRLFKRIEQIIKPKKNPNKIPFSRSESIQIKIGVWAIAIAIITPVILFIIDKVYF